MSENNNALLEAAVSGDSLQTDFTPIDPGTYAGTVKSWELKTFPAKEPGKSDTRIIEATITINDSEVAEAVGRDEPTSRHAMFLNFNEDGSVSDNNIGLGRFFEACDAKDGNGTLLEKLNECIGCSVAATVAHRPHDDVVYDEVKKVENSAVLDD